MYDKGDIAVRVTLAACLALVLADSAFADARSRKLYCITEGSVGVDDNQPGKRVIEDNERSFFASIHISDKPTPNGYIGYLVLEGGSIGVAIAFDTKDGTSFSSTGNRAYATIIFGTDNRFAAAYIDRGAKTGEPFAYALQGKCTEVPAPR